MKIQMWHVDSFKCTITEKGRSRFVEEITDKETSVEEALIVFTAVEKADGKNPESAHLKTAEAIASHARNLKVENIVVHPFAHLFADLGSPQKAVKIMDGINELLNQQGFNSIRTPFGWFNRLDIKAKGHPLSRASKMILPD